MTTGRINQISALNVRGSKPLTFPGHEPPQRRESLGAEASEAIKPSGANRLGRRANEDWNVKTASEFFCRASSQRRETIDTTQTTDERYRRVGSVADDSPKAFAITRSATTSDRETLVAQKFPSEQPEASTPPRPVADERSRQCARPLLLAETTVRNY